MLIYLILFFLVPLCGVIGFIVAIVKVIIQATVAISMVAIFSLT